MNWERIQSFFKVKYFLENKGQMENMIMFYFSFSVARYQVAQSISAVYQGWPHWLVCDHEGILDIFYINNICRHIRLKLELCTSRLKF